jgi:2-iminobutanoate/2-iminopropanoate deaminase
MLAAHGSHAGHSLVACEIIEDLLTAHGAGLAGILHIRTFMLDLADLPAYSKVRRRLFPSNPPASTTVQVSGLFLPGLALEVEVTAAVQVTEAP